MAASWEWDFNLISQLAGDLDKGGGKYYRMV
jgi:hypothetical protein